MNRNFLKTLFLALALPLLASQPVAAQKLVGYEATYRLTLKEIDYKGAVLTAKGAMAMRFTRNCARWQSHAEFLFFLELDNGNRLRTHTMTRQRESLDGTSVEFVFWQDLSGEGRLEFRGNATLPSDGEAGTVKYVKPKRFEKKLPKGVESPVASMRQIVEALVAEGTTAKHHYFDPQAKFVEIRNIGGIPIILTSPPKGDAQLVDGRSWRLRATPIPDGDEEESEQDEALKEKDDNAGYTMMQVHDTGVASYMLFKSGITTIKAELTEVRQLPLNECVRPTAPLELDATEETNAEAAEAGENGAADAAGPGAMDEDGAAEDLPATEADEARVIVPTEQESTVVEASATAN